MVNNARLNYYDLNKKNTRSLNQDIDENMLWKHLMKTNQYMNDISSKDIMDSIQKVEAIVSNVFKFICLDGLLAQRNC